MENINNAIIQSVEMIINKKLEALLNNDKVATVTGIKTIGRTKKFIVKMDGGEYLVYDGVNLNPPINTKVWIHLPNGKLEQAYISAIAN